MENFDLRKYIAENKLHEALPEKEYQAVKQIGTDLKDKAAQLATIDTVDEFLNLMGEIIDLVSAQSPDFINSSRFITAMTKLYNSRKDMQSDEPAGDKPSENNSDKNSDKISNEEAATIAQDSVPNLEKSSELNALADKMAKDPKALEALQKLYSQLNENEIIKEFDVTKIAKAFANKASKKAASLEESTELNENYAAALMTGLVGGGTLANYAAGLNDVITPIMKIQGHSPSHMSAALIGALAGAALLVIGKKVLSKEK